VLRTAPTASAEAQAPLCRSVRVDLTTLSHLLLQDVLKPGGWLETLLVEDQSVLGWLRAFFTRGRRSVELLKALGERLESRITTHLLSS